MHLILFLHYLSTQYGILQMDMRLMRQRSKLKSMKRKMNHWSGKTSWSGWVLCLMVLFFMLNPVSRNACCTKLEKIYQEHQIHQADFVWRIWLKFFKIINSTKLILLGHIWLKFVQIVNSVKQISLWTKLAKIVKSMNIHLVSHFCYCVHFWVVLLSG